MLRLQFGCGINRSERTDPLGPGRNGALRATPRLPRTWHPRALRLQTHARLLEHAMTMTSGRTALPREERTAHGVELREGNDGLLRFSGVASTVAQSYEVYEPRLGGSFMETIAPG